MWCISATEKTAFPPLSHSIIAVCPFLLWSYMCEHHKMNPCRVWWQRRCPRPRDRHGDLADAWQVQEQFRGLLPVLAGKPGGDAMQVRLTKLVGPGAAPSHLDGHPCTLLLTMEQMAGGDPALHVSTQLVALRAQALVGLCGDHLGDERVQGLRLVGLSPTGLGEGHRDLPGFVSDRMVTGDLGSTDRWQEGLVGVDLDLQGRLYTRLQADLEGGRRPVHILGGHQRVAARVLPSRKGAVGDRDVEATTGAVDRACADVACWACCHGMGGHGHLPVGLEGGGCRDHSVLLGDNEHTMGCAEGRSCGDGLYVE